MTEKKAPEESPAPQDSEKASALRPEEAAPKRLQVAAAASLDIFATGGPAVPRQAPQAPLVSDAPLAPTPRPADAGPIGADIFATGGGAPPPTAPSPVSSPAPQVAWQPEGHLAAGRYLIHEVIGRGGMGRVYKATDTRHNQAIAIKSLEAHLIGTEWSQQWLQELQLHQRLHHPHIAPMRDLERDPHMGFFLTMDYIEGCDVEHALQVGKSAGQVVPFAKDTTIALLHQIAAALDHAHGQGVVHLDIKPSNVLLQQPSPLSWLQDAKRAKRFTFAAARLIDFGIARLRAGNSGGQIIGTVYYMPPEQLSGSGPLTPATDIYALGVMAYQLLTGQIFQGGMPGPSELNEHLSPAIDKVHEKVVAYRPKDRFQRASAFVEALEQSLSSRVTEVVRLGQPAKEKVVVKHVVEYVAERGGDTVVQMPALDQPTPSEQRWPQIKERIEQKRPDWLEAPFPRKAPKVVAASSYPQAAFADWPVKPLPESLILLDRSDHPLLELCPIPAGTFLMGTHAKDRSARRQDKPQQSVEMRSYYLSRTPITNRMWQIFLEESRYKQPSNAQHPHYLHHWPQMAMPGHEHEHPLHHISMIDAWAFCDLYGVALPSEAQWEYGLRGSDGRPFPWGEQLPSPKDPTSMVAHIAQPRQSTMPVGARSGGASPFGILDGIGPIFQWVADEYDSMWLKRLRGVDPVCHGQRREAFYTLRGANATTPPEQAQLYRRHNASPDTCREDIGFRICLDL